MATIIILAGILQIIGGKMSFTPASASFVGPLGLPVEYWSYKRLIREVLVDQDTIINWCKRNGLLARSQICTRCNKSMLWEIDSSRNDGYRYTTNNT